MMKGKTRIELTDVHTGEVEVVEEENMITDALQYLFDPVGYVKAGDVMFGTDYAPFYKILTGGLLLLNKTVEENADNIFQPEDVGQTGCAVFGQQNTSDQTMRGNYNATESEIDLENRKVKYVYDFDTAEGNGTIACVALTHAQGGYSTDGFTVEPVRTSYPLFKALSAASLRYTGTNSGITGADRTYSYSSYGTGYKWILKIDAVKDLVYYFTILSNTSIQVSCYRANLSSMSLFDSPKESRTLIDSWDISLSEAINQQYFSYNYDEESDKFYIVSGTSYYVSSNAAFVVTEVDMANDFTVKQYSMTNKCGMNMRVGYLRASTMCYRGYLYFQNYISFSGTSYLFRQEIGNSANIQQLATLTKESYFAFARSGRVYLEQPSSYTPYLAIFYLSDLTVKYPETYYLYESSHRQYVSIAGNPLLYYLTYGTSNGTFGIRTDYLATINNLSTPVVKTADKTMKVTYTLQEA